MKSRFRLIDRRTLLSGLAALLSSPALGAGPEVSLRPVLRGALGGHMARRGPGALIKKAGLSGRLACAVADVQTSQLLEHHNGALGLPPASVAKAVTALYALDTLGSDYRFATRLVGTGPIVDGKLTGDLVLVGGGDPTLDTDALGTLASALKARGIHSVTGGFFVDDSALPYQAHIDKAQPDHVGYNPAVSGIALNYNRVHFEWQRTASAYAVTMQARSRNLRPSVDIAQMKVVDRSSPVYSFKSGQKSDEWSVARIALGDNGGRWLPVRKPGLYAGEVFATLARSHGIILRPAKIIRHPPRGTVIASHQSKPLIDILQSMLRYSNNLTAEMIGASASIRRTGSITSLQTSAEVMNRWAMTRLGMLYPALVDHSGLSGASRMSPDDMVRGLIHAGNNARLRPILRRFGLRDANGRPDNNHPVQVHAKTGTLNFVSGLAGYFTAPNGAEMAFAIFAADTATRSGIPKENRESPPGAKRWNRRAKGLQQKLIEHWSARFGA